MPDAPKSKKCTTCKVEKDITEYNKNKCKKDGFQTLCRDCSKNKSKTYYHSNEGKHKAVVYKRNKKVRVNNRNMLLQYFAEHPCIDCGESDISCLEFDHVIGKKIRAVSTMLGRSNCSKTILLEIEKCVVRCANCHRKKTAKDQNWYKQNCNIVK